MKPRDVSRPATAPVGSAPDSRDLAVLDDVDAARVGGAGVAPGDGVVTRRAAAPLQRGAEHGIADRPRDVERRAEGLRLLGRQPFVVYAVEAVGVDVALEALDVVLVMREHHHAALGEHHVVIELLRQALPELDRMLVDRRALVIEVVRADDRRVAPGIAAAEPALLDNRDIGRAMRLGEVIGGGEAMAARADDHDVVMLLRLRIAPLPPPSAMAARRFGEQRSDGETTHGAP